MNEPKQEPFCEVFFSSSLDDKDITSLIVTTKFRDPASPRDTPPESRKKVPGNGAALIFNALKPVTSPQASLASAVSNKSENS